ncbi:MAG: GDP-mannose 4,6-dehydratase [Ferruginibacter sp.]
MTAIIFGINGQDGFYLEQLLLSLNIIVHGVGRKDIDISNYEKVAALIKDKQPEYIFHLAANSTTRHDALFENHATISTGTLNILEAVKNFSTHSKVFISGSGLQFKNNNRPIKEADAFEARDAYSVSRIQSVYAARYYRSLGIKTYVGYFFNHDSPRRTERHMAMKIAAASKRISAGSKEKIEIGDMSVVKEWTFAGDIVKGVWLLVNQDDIYEANISSGEGHSIADWVKACFKIIGKNPDEYLVEKKSFIPEYKELVSDNSIIASLGFKTNVSFAQLAAMMIGKEPGSD